MKNRETIRNRKREKRADNQSERERRSIGTERERNKSQREQKEIQYIKERRLEIKLEIKINREKHGNKD